MLYLSTRNKYSSYTAHRALLEARTPDGGFYVPLQITQLSDEELRSFKTRNFGENTAYILNIFFAGKLTGWDIEFCCGRSPVRLVDLPRRLHIVELWHNICFDYAHVEQAIYNRLTNTDTPLPQNGWAKIAIEIAILFAIYGDTSTVNNGLHYDIAVETRGFISPFAVWYARKMGLPIGTIICGTHDNGEVWDLLHLGTMTPNANIDETLGIERFIYCALGSEEALRYVSSCDTKRVYALDDSCAAILKTGLSAAVVSSERLPAVISNFYRSHGYVLDSASAIAFGALQDYRSCTGESKNTLILSFVSPIRNRAAVTHLLGISASELEAAVIRQRG